MVSEFPENPLALLGVYNVTSQVVDEASQQVTAGSEFRVNVDITRLSAGFVDVLVRIKVNGKTIDFQREISLAGQTIGAEFFEEVFGSMGAEVTGDYALKFTLTSNNYSELVEAGIISDGQTLVLSLDKTKDLSAGEGLDDETTGGDSSEETPVEPGEVPVETVTISGQPETVVHGGASFPLTAKVSPSNATNQGVKWSSSHPEYISVDENTGFVRILGYTSEPVTITAYSVENGNIKNEWTFNIKKATVTDIKVTPENMTLTLRNDDSTVSANITTAVEPAIASEYTDINYAVTTGQDKISVDTNGVVTALQEGSATVTVTAGTFTKTVTVTVKPIPDQEIPVENISISTSSDKVYEKGTNVTIEFTLTPPDTTDNIVSYTTSNSSGSIPTSNGTGSFEFLNVQGGETVTLITAKGQQVTYTVTAVDTITTVSFVNGRITVEQNQTASNTLNNEEIIKNSSSSITYESLNQDIATVDSATGEVTGVKNGLATIQVTVQPKYDSTPLTATFEVDVLGHINYDDEESLVGTYDIVFFATNSNGKQWIGMIDSRAIIATDCEIYKSLWSSSSCTTGGLGDFLLTNHEEFAGRAVINVVDNVLKVHTKVAMLFTGMNGTAASAAENDRYQYSVYGEKSLSGWLDSNVIGSMPGRNLSETTNLKNPKYAFEDKQNYTGYTKLDIVLFSHFEGKSTALGDVNPDTRLVLRKISSQATSMDPNTLTEVPFDKLNGKLTLNSKGNINVSFD